MIHQANPEIFAFKLQKKDILRKTPMKSEILNFSFSACIAWENLLQNFFKWIFQQFLYEFYATQPYLYQTSLIYQIYVDDKHLITA